MAIFHCYVSSPEGKWVVRHQVDLWNMFDGTSGRGGAWDEYLAEPHAHHGDERQRPGFFNHL